MFRSKQTNKQTDKQTDGIVPIVVFDKICSRGTPMLRTYVCVCVFDDARRVPSPDWTGLDFRLRVGAVSDDMSDGLHRYGRDGVRYVHLHRQR